MFQKLVGRSTVQSGLFDALALMGLQALVVVFVALAWGLSSFHAMLSVLLGGAVCILPNCYFAMRFFTSGQNSNEPNKIVQSFYKAGIVKLLMTAGFALIIFTELHVYILPFISGFVVATLGLWWTPLLTKFKPDARVS